MTQKTNLPDYGYLHPLFHPPLWQTHKGDYWWLYYNWCCCVDRQWHHWSCTRVHQFVENPLKFVETSDWSTWVTWWIQHTPDDSQLPSRRDRTWLVCLSRSRRDGEWLVCLFLSCSRRCWYLFNFRRIIRSNMVIPVGRMVFLFVVAFSWVCSDSVSIFRMFGVSHMAVREFPLV